MESESILVILITLILCKKRKQNKKRRPRSSKQSSSQIKNQTGEVNSVTPGRPYYFFFFFFFFFFFPFSLFPFFHFPASARVPVSNSTFGTRSFGELQQDRLFPRPLGLVASYPRQLRRKESCDHKARMEKEKIKS
ncbi:hypothetical protein BO85DRAFT_67951 [Aspergillus piperis CBS 112811]|uniref:Uncharacterized protein n=1 Tax=Aspergillus piperis CBS 112811 TaxID=1448313 RepID=A0A8G1QZQ9_9EURO|nr:hypothetical protein BO85DRAFT_67951 [Aspergillus piperis CBS 112811]RAH55857.1 hypothetical protein BO85DRAFT_67951 [Aspergillus piperis CBS 112811]